MKTPLIRFSITPRITGKLSLLLRAVLHEKSILSFNHWFIAASVLQQKSQQQQRVCCKAQVSSSLVRSKKRQANKTY